MSMPRCSTPSTARPIYATPRPGYATSSNPFVTQFPGKNPPPAEDSPARQAFLSVPNIIRPPSVRSFSNDLADPVRIAGSAPVNPDLSVDSFGQISAYDTGTPVKDTFYPGFLEPTALEFSPASRLRIPSSRSVSSRSVSPISSSSSLSSSSFSSSSLSSSSSNVFRPPSPVFVPPIQYNSESEKAYRHYRQLLRKDPRNGASTVVRSLLSEGVRDTQSGQIIAALAHHLTSGDDALGVRLRSESLGMFNTYWQNSGPWQRDPCVDSHVYHNTRGVNIAAFLGSLYAVGMLSASDVHQSLDVLFEAGPNCYKFFAAHALFVQCGDRICSGNDAVRTFRLRERLQVRDTDRAFTWGRRRERTRALLVDWLDLIDSWLARQEKTRSTLPRIFTPQSTPAGSVGSSRSSSAAPRTPRMLNAPF
ncbi:hypothetical protein B0H10DRAFT_1055172 [Mycena sp. CBHHK59/15]|nr:hypothetical protein B0H10DRAFT_1055172 [Mycena sp. CBHHK59/15]